MVTDKTTLLPSKPHRMGGNASNNVIRDFQYRENAANKGSEEAVDSLCVKLEKKLQFIIANVLTEVRALIWIF
ncbi:hypothetical protein [Paenibacillus sp. PAMC21692]|uniref:hypothetical protein n=1 Tax=Paenibacillus sp. PAMC21692 TaxID=2762320 RepID=UPI00164E4B9A|nr:hypothetical protein [Paenibacillus sp. PAMC21692]QNK56095.1 hypothetical protein H7F31_26555 [Paenibacillus sp. PAMC21692]